MWFRVTGGATMRKLWISALLVVGSLAGISTAAAENFAPVMSAALHRQQQAAAAPACGCEAPAKGPACDACGGCNQCCTCNGGGACDPCGAGCGHGCFGCFGCFGKHGHHGHHCRRNAYDRSSSFHCGCNGSYKFPVPPLSTYHWPGMYSHQLMTDYHSPWRFPPIKPYVDEVPIVEMGIDEESMRPFYPVSTMLPGAAAPTGEGESMSAKVFRLAE
jgi:hypothetical protein